MNEKINNKKSKEINSKKGKQISEHLDSISMDVWKINDKSNNPKTGSKTN